MWTDMRTKITIKQRSTSQNDYGEPVDTWTNVVTNVWASIEPITGREFFAAQQVHSDVNMKVRMIYDSSLAGIKPSMIVTFGTRTLEIDAVINYKERNREILLMCKEEVI